MLEKIRLLPCTIFEMLVGGNIFQKIGTFSLMELINAMQRLPEDIRYPILDIRYWIFDIGYSILDIRHWIFDIGYSILDIGYWIFDIVYSTFDIGFGYSILDIRYWIFEIGN